jgi:hypothetical protein
VILAAVYKNELLPWNMDKHDLAAMEDLMSGEVLKKNVRLLSEKIA